MIRVMIMIFVKIFMVFDEDNSDPDVNEKMATIITMMKTMMLIMMNKKIMTGTMIVSIMTVTMSMVLEMN